MDKRKLIQIIEKELEELKILSEEIAESEDKTSLIIDLTLSKARLLCQEIELLRELTAIGVEIPADDSPEENEEEQIDEDEVSDVTISDPELEIVDFEEPEDDEFTESDDDDEINPEDSDEDETEYDDNDDDLDESEPEFTEEEIEEEGLIEFGVNDNGEIKEDEDVPAPKLPIESTELKTEAQSGVREITIDMDEDDDLEPVKVSTASGITDRPVMREIPKPEELVQEKPVAGESFQKERSLNDSIGETKSTESPINSGAISSLRASIGLNDRFLFIREIFNNNTDKYNTVIDHLDKLETIQQAVDYLKANLTLQKNETSMKFVDLLKRRFSK